MSSSGIYILNDLRDIKSDMVHPVKRNRAIASGKVSKVSAVIIPFNTTSLRILIFVFSG